MSDEVLLERRDDGIAIVTLNRPRAMNALSISLRAALHETMETLRQDDEVRVIVLTGAGEKAFTAGLDLKELGSEGSALTDALAPDPVTNPVEALLACGKPVIGAINGVAITGGFELALACDVLIASDNARFADTHALVGIMPGWGLSQKLPRIIGMSRAREASLTGRFIDAETAREWGLVNQVVPAERLLDAAMEIAAPMADLDPDFVRDYRALMDRGFDLPYSEALTYEQGYAREYDAGVTAEDIEQRRNSVMEKGRARGQ